MCIKSVKEIPAHRCCNSALNKTQKMHQNGLWKVPLAYFYTSFHQFAALRYLLSLALYHTTKYWT